MKIWAARFFEARGKRLFVSPLHGHLPNGSVFERFSHLRTGVREAAAAIYQIVVRIAF
jgi:hypothetical protein